MAAAADVGGDAFAAAAGGARRRPDAGAAAGADSAPGAAGATARTRGRDRQPRAAARSRAAPARAGTAAQAVAGGRAEPDDGADHRHRGAIEYVNPKFEQVTGWRLDEVRGRSPRLLKSGCTEPPTYAQLWRTILAGAEWRGELCNRKKNGETYWEHLAAISPVRDERGAVSHFLAEAEDITERKRLQQEIADSHRRRAETQALAAMGQAASMIAHDLRNPLSTIKMSLGILGERAGDALSEGDREINRIALDQVRYMEEVLSDLLLYARPDALQPAWLDLPKLLDAAVLLAEREIEEQRVRVECRYQSGLPTLHGDATKLRQAFTNLVLNAVQATEGVADRAAEVSVCARLSAERQPPRSASGSATTAAAFRRAAATGCSSRSSPAAPRAPASGCRLPSASSISTAARSSCAACRRAGPARW
ncbi:MAG: PAS domain S-box protein [Ideonella sp.]|nr:PAS domain S-box protein [Ideonella sp.]